MHRPCTTWLAAALAAATLAAPAAADSTKAAAAQVHKGATALTWLSHPQHQHFGTYRSRHLAYSRAYRTLMAGLSYGGWLRAAICIHGYEGSWQDPNGPYYGGMQMDTEFQSTYGPLYVDRWGTADHWPVWAQLHTAWRAWQTRGWYPWPNTARWCGLI